MNNQKLTQTGQALFGERWKTDLAKALGYKGGSIIHRWMDGSRPFPRDIEERLKELLNERLRVLWLALGEYY